ncbi:MAG TPA: DUF4260 domain-containing protein [Candidatus Saccharimonadales bacterium]|nr:DUF4260 domain-containing protein [Candidatus Saccharimonadales bacterium]
MRNLPIWFQRVEAALLFVAMTALYLILHGNTWLFVLLFFSFDLSILGYLAGPRVGAVVYNIFHSFTLPLLCAALGLLSNQLVWLDSLAMIWLAHIGFDRMLGFGLKYPDRFGHTHLSTK